MQHKHPVITCLLYLLVSDSVQQRKYGRDICWVHNTFYVPTDDVTRLPSDDATKERNEIRYYQWIVSILLLQAVGFLLPHYFWRWAMGKARVDLKSISDCLKSKVSVIIVQF